MSDSPQLPPVTTRKTVTHENPTVLLEPHTTTTTTTDRGFGDIIPTILPALQSSSYVLVILFAFLAWSSRKLITTFLDNHLDLMVTVKDGLEQQQLSNNKHATMLELLTKNNAVLARTLEVSAEARAFRRGADEPLN